MTITRSALTVTLLLSACASGVAATSQAGPSVETWAAELQTGRAATARSALRALADGETGDPRTRDAVFALSRDWLDRGAAPASPDARLPLTAALLFPGDPRTVPLLVATAGALLDAGDQLGAHLVLVRLTAIDDLSGLPALRTRAAANAATVGDAAVAFAWSQGLDPSELPPPLAATLLAARLKSAEELGRSGAALAAARSLVAGHREALHVDGPALLAAARVHAGAGLLERAIELYRTYVNVHPVGLDWRAAQLALARLQARTGQISGARLTLTWLVERAPGTPAATEAHLDLLELGQPEATVDRIDPYLEVMRQAPDLARVQQACERFATRFMSAGLPLELGEALARLAREPGDSLAPLAARGCLEAHLAAMLALLEARGDRVGMAALAVLAGSLELRAPQEADALIRAARRGLGLGPAPRDVLGRTIAAVREALPGSEDLADRLADLELTLAFVRDAPAGARAEAALVAGEALWRLDRTDEALARIEAAFDDATGAAARALRVLRADVLFAGGRREQACDDYRLAGGPATRWVQLQLERCAETAEQEEAGHDTGGVETNGATS